jgi:hypothetical protein
MTQLPLFAPASQGEVFWGLAEQSGSALREFYTSSGDERINAYSRFAKSCNQFAQQNGYSFLEASTKIHNMFNIKTFGN